MNLNIILSVSLLGVVALISIIVFLINQHKQFAILFERLQHSSQEQQKIQQLLDQQQKFQQEQRHQFDQHQMSSLALIQDSLQKGLKSISEHVGERLREISGQVDKRLSTGFEKTTETFTNVIKRLAIIDEAQKKITELSTNVIGLQDVLTDKRSRGAFGEVQLASLIRNMIPESHFALQYTLSNNKRVDCLLFLPNPTGNVAIDAKFPLETYHQLMKQPAENKLLEQQFRQDIRRHIDDIATKYIIEGETADGAILFIPAEAIFAEIHGHFPGLVEYAQQRRVWLVSPTTLMAVLTTARAVLKDDATRKQVHIIQEHLVALSKDFSRFQKRMDDLSKHIQKAHEDVEQVHKSSQKITRRFNRIEQVELQDTKEQELALLQD